MSTRVVIADDHDLLRTGLARVLDTADDIEVVGEARSGPECVEVALRLRPDVVVMDVQMPGGDGIAATARLRERLPRTRVLILTLFDLDEYVIGGLRAGAAGFLLKTTAPDGLIQAVRCCAAGQTTVGATVMERLVGVWLVAGVTEAPELERLTERERDVLGCLADGLSNGEIARRLYIAETTVKTHVARVLAKLGARDRLQAAIMAHRAGLGTPDGSSAGTTRPSSPRR